MTARTASAPLSVLIGRQLAHPGGWAGQLLAVAMQVANRLPNRAILEALDARAGQTVVDLGCGEGSLIARIPRTVATIGIDRSSAMVAAATRRNRAAIAAGQCRVVMGDILNVSLGDRSVDRIIASNVLYFCNDIPALIAECRRVARPGAKLLIYVTARSTMRKWRFASNATHRHFSAWSLREELQQAGVDQAAMRLTRLRLPAKVEGLLLEVRLSPAD